jgi:hypothetical protein
MDGWDYARQMKTIDTIGGLISSIKRVRKDNAIV